VTASKDRVYQTVDVGGLVRRQNINNRRISRIVGVHIYTYTRITCS